MKNINNLKAIWIKVTGANRATSESQRISQSMSYSDILGDNPLFECENSLLERGNTNNGHHANERKVS